MRCALRAGEAIAGRRGRMVRGESPRPRVFGCFGAHETNAAPIVFCSFVLCGLFLVSGCEQTRRVTISWQAPGEREKVAGYNIECARADQTGRPGTRKIDGAETTRATLRLPADRSYRIRVFARDAAGHLSAGSNEVLVGPSDRKERK